MYCSKHIIGGKLNIHYGDSVTQNLVPFEHLSDVMGQILVD